MSAEGEGIRFEVDRIADGEPGQLEISGRWYGVRGRRFMRPALILTLRSDGSQHRALADLEDKPWAAEEGDAWRAAFPMTVELGEASEIELAVAPDITVDLTDAHESRAGRGRQPARTVAAGPQARVPQVRSAGSRPRPRRSPEVERLRERMEAAELALERERVRRSAVEETLESERQTARKLQAEVGRYRAEQELAETVQRELETASAGLDALRAEARETSRGLEDTVRALEDERRANVRLKRSLTDAQAAVRRLTQASEEADRRSTAAARSERQPTAAPRSERQPTVPARSERQPTAAPRGERQPTVPARSERQPTAAPRSERPLNPALQGSNALVRGLALVLIVGVIVAVFLLIRSTVG